MVNIAAQPVAPGSKPPLESGWEKPSIVVPRRIIAAVSGHQKNGKTDFALSAPEPIFYHNFDDGMEGVVEELAKAGKEIYIKRYRMPNDRMDPTMKMARANEVFATYQKMWADSVARGKGTVVVDTHSEEWEIRRLAKFGKLTQVPAFLYTEVNNDLRTDVREAYESGMNIILLQKMKKAYVGKDWSGKWEPSGYSDLPFLVQANLEAFRDPADGLFKIMIKDCRQNASLSNTVMVVDRGSKEVEDALTIMQESQPWMTEYSAFEDFLSLVFDPAPAPAA